MKNKPLKQAQLFIKVGQNRFALVDKAIKGVQMYIWDDDQQRIIPMSYK